MSKQNKKCTVCGEYCSKHPDKRRIQEVKRHGDGNKKKHG